MKVDVYNLQFPPYIKTLRLGGYLFERVEGYPDAFSKLQHLVESSGSEFSATPNDGSHQITATVEEVTVGSSSLEWSMPNPSQLDDIMLFLDLFTGRSVFYKNWTDDGVVIVRDPQTAQWGGQFRLSTHDETGYLRVSDGVIIPKDVFETMPQARMMEYHPVNLGFEKTINEVLGLIATPDWQNEYKKGYFLFLFKHGVRRQMVETAFLTCWTIWEHLFALHNTQLSEQKLQRTDATDKITYILQKYFARTIDQTATDAVIRIKRARHVLVHYGKRPTNVDVKEMELLIRLTEQLMAIVLGLNPSNAFNSLEGLSRLLATP